jgi:hypothetical protein
MTVGELRAQLEELEDGMMVVLSTDPADSGGRCRGGNELEFVDVDYVEPHLLSNEGGPNPATCPDCTYALILFPAY